MDRKRIIGVIGEANLKGDKNKEKISFELGKLLIDNGFFIATGGMGGVMENASKGAKDSSNYKEGMVLGVLPDYVNPGMNEYIDIVIPTGMGLARNTLLVSMCDAVIVIGGRSGTLSEMALAWQMGKMVIALDVDGWSGNLKSVNLDDRRKDEVFSAKTSKEAIKILLNKIDDYPLEFTGVNKAKVSKKEAMSLIEESYEIKGKLEHIGGGNEGLVYHDKKHVYKLITRHKNPFELYWKLKALSETIYNNRVQYLLPFEVTKEKDCILLKYDYLRTKSYKGGYEKEMINLAKELKRLGWLYTNFNPDNIRIRKKNDSPVIIDIGRSFEPYSEELFRKTCRKLFLTYLMGDKNNIKKHLTETNESEKFSSLKNLEYDPRELQSKFEDFFNKISIVNKKEILNPLISIIIQNQDDIETIFDYGSGHGDIAKMLVDKGLDVTAYDPNSELYEIYKDTYYQDVRTVSKNELEELIDNGEKFDCVISSLVLCHPLHDKKKERDKIILEVINNIVDLTSRYIIITICNPLYTMKTKTDLQSKTLPQNFDYIKENKIKKRVKITNKFRQDFHRPMSFYEKLFSNNNLKIIRIEQTRGRDIKNPDLFYSDFIAFLLEVKNPGTQIRSK